MFHIDTSVEIFLPFIKCFLKILPPILVLTMNKKNTKEHNKKELQQMQKCVCFFLAN